MKISARYFTCGGKTKIFATRFAAGAILCAIVTCARWRLGAFFALCDGAFAAATVLMCAGIFSAIGKVGAFSAISFGMKTLAARFGRNSSADRKLYSGDKKQTYFDYVHEKRRKTCVVDATSVGENISDGENNLSNSEINSGNTTWSYFATGGFFLALAFLFLVII